MIEKYRTSDETVKVLTQARVGQYLRVGGSLSAKELVEPLRLGPITEVKEERWYLRGKLRGGHGPGTKCSTEG